MPAVKKYIRSLYSIFLLLRGFFRLSRTNQIPVNIKGAYDLADAVLEMGLNHQTTSYLMADESTKNLLQIKYGLDHRFEANVLSLLPKGSLGSILYHSCFQKGFDPSFYLKYPVREIKSDYDWISSRGRKLHDIFHLITGYPPSIIGEIGVFAFIAGNHSDAATFFISAGTVFAGIYNNPSKFHIYLKVFAKAFYKGTLVKPLLGFKFEENLSMNILEMRELLGLPIYGLAHGTIDTKYIKGYEFKEHQKTKSSLTA